MPIRLFSRGCLVAVVGWIVVQTSAATVVAFQVAALKAGAATSNITPELGSPIIGGFSPFPSTHIHDELHARCLVLDDGNIRLAIVVCDLLGIHRRVSDEARRLIDAATGIPPEQVLICATHTHSAASAIGLNSYDPDQELDAYQSFVARRICDGVRRAINQLQDAELAIGAVDAPEHVHNRRWRMKAGAMPANPFGRLDEVRMNPPAGSPDLLEPAGPTDPVVSLLAVRGVDGSPLALWATYSLHYVGDVGQGHVSADYFAEFCTELTRLLGADHAQPAFVPMLANGTSGDVNNIDFRDPKQSTGPYSRIRAVAHDIASKVHQAWPKLSFRRDVQLAARYRELDIGSRVPTEDDLSWARKTLEIPEVAGKVDLSRIYAERTLRLARVPPVLPVPLQVFRIGDAVVGTMPCEVFCEIGLEFRARRKDSPAWLVSLTHGYYGYLPTPAQHRLGGYETWLGTNRLETGASERMVETLLELAAATDAEP